MSTDLPSQSRLFQLRLDGQDPIVHHVRRCNDMAACVNERLLQSNLPILGPEFSGHNIISRWLLPTGRFVQEHRTKRSDRNKEVAALTH